MLDLSNLLYPLVLFHSPSMAVHDIVFNLLMMAALSSTYIVGILHTHFTVLLLYLTDDILDNVELLN